MLETLREKWDDILLYMKEEYDISDISFTTWLKPLKLFNVTKDDRVQLIVPEQNFLMYIRKKYAVLLKVAIEEVTGFRCEIELLTGSEAAGDTTSSPAPEKEKQSDKYVQAITAANLNPRYTFDTFVVGASNNLAHAASLAVAESPGEIYNPLFIYGGVGLGKTHLMQSIANYVLRNNPQAKVLYVTSETFTNELIDAIRNKNNISTTEFRQKYRSNDVLLIDDIQFIIGKESTQEEFFHTFNALYEEKKQIIVTSDRPPKEIETLEERLRSRFEWGLTVDIQPPDYETRMAILRKKEELDGYNIDNEVLKYIAANVKSNIRELEGALTKILALSKLQKNCEVTVELAEEALKDIVSPSDSKVITPDGVIQVVADQYNISVEDIKSKKKSKDIAYPRQVAMYLCRTMTDASLEDIGQVMGGRDHSTVLYGEKKIGEDMKLSPTLQNTIDILKKKLNPQ